jgi:hypothetical protein
MGQKSDDTGTQPPLACGCYFFQHPLKGGHLLVAAISSSPDFSIWVIFALLFCWLLLG